MIGLCYEPKDEKLTLSIKSVKIGSQSSLKVSKDVGLYAKGQEISDGNCGISNSPKKSNETFSLIIDL